MLETSPSGDPHTSRVPPVGDTRAMREVGKHERPLPRLVFAFEAESTGPLGMERCAKKGVNREIAGER
jgi:hypothetical protein